MDYALELIRGRPINYNGLIFNPVSFAEICDNIGLENFNNIIMPFCVTKEFFNIPDDIIDTINLFEDIIIKNNDMVTCICLTIQLFCKCNNIKKNEQGILLFNGIDENPYFIINSNNFEDISNIILKINGKEKIKIEKPPKNMSARQQDVWNKIQAGRKKESDKNTIHIYDMINVCEYGGNYRIPVEEIEKWTLWKIMSCYKARLNMKTYDDNLKICLVSGDGKSISGNNHWLQQLMIRD